MVTEKRQYNRRDLEDIAAKLFRKSDLQEVDFCPMNVSRKGLSIMSSAALPVGSHLFLALDAKDVPLIVRWCKPKDDDPAVFRAGLETEDQEDHLDELIKNEMNF